MAENTINIKVTKYQSKILFDKHRFAMFYTGRRGGKTRTGVMKQCLKGLQNPNIRLAYFGLTATMTKKTAYKEAINFVPSHFLDLRKCSLSSPPSLVFKNGTIYDFWSTGKIQNLRGGGYEDVFVDEIQNQPEDLYAEIIRPMVAESGGTILGMGTTQGASNWSYNFFKDEEWYCKAYSAIKMGVISPKEIESLRATMDDRTFRQEIMAEIVNFAGTAYYEYSEKNQCSTSFNPNYDTVITFDFNVNPMTCTVLQQYELNKWNCTKTFTLYNSNTFEMCETVKTYLNMSQFCGNLISTGDFAGTQMRSSATANDWKIIDSYFSMFRNYKHKIKFTRSISDRINSLNVAFKNLVINVDVEQCQDLHEDLLKTTRKDDGQLNDNGGKRTHWSDGLSYFTYNFYPIENLFKKPTRI